MLRRNVLSFAVFAFAVDETNERDDLMTSATPFALLRKEVEHAAEPDSHTDVLLVSVQFSELHKCTLLVPQIRLLLLHKCVLVYR